MTKAEKEKKMTEVGIDLVELNETLYFAADNETRMRAAQRAYLKLGMLLGLADCDYYHPKLMEIREVMEKAFGNWAIVKPDSCFDCVDDQKLAEIAKEHKEHFLHVTRP